VLVELLAQTGGFAASTTIDDHGRGQRLRVAAFGPFKFPGGAGPHATLEAFARVVGRMGGLVKIEGEVTADGVVVASGSITLAET
jgi:3-hydroxymyristoyl/3-hydroxydecanoyl-(acyl carrier protein) dehydratase